MAYLQFLFWLAMIAETLIFFILPVLTVVARKKINPSRRKPVKLLEPWQDPFGSTTELVRWAERRAYREHQRHLSQDWGEDMTAVKDRFREKSRTGEVMVISGLATINEARGKYERYLPGKGLVKADTPELLDRACQVIRDEPVPVAAILKEEFETFAHWLGIVDQKLATARGEDREILMEQRLKIWNYLKSIIDRMERAEHHGNNDHRILPSDHLHIGSA